jgi:serine/threonine protein kinase
MNQNGHPCGDGPEWLLAMEPFTQFGKYQILDRIAFGGMAELYRARIQGDEGFQKWVALKKMHAHFSVQPEVVEAFIEEAKLAAFLQHPNIVQIYDFGCMDDAYFIVMEYLQGKDLRTLTTALADRRRPLGLENSLAIAACICSGLEYAHRLTDIGGRPLQIVHRDISPQNIFVTYAGQVKILDFGIAKATDRGATTEAGVLKGKVAYMSPEQAQGKPIDHRSDIFAVGIILYELLTGQRLYQGNTMEILRRAQDADFVPPEEYLTNPSAELQAVFRHLLAARPEERFADCAAVLAALEECLGDLTSRSIERHLAELVSDLFAEEKVAEEAVLQDLLSDEVAPNRTEGSPDGPDTTSITTGDNIPPSPPPPEVAAVARHRSGPNWLSIGLIGLLVAVFFLMWVRWHIPQQGQGQSLEAFQARNYSGSGLAGTRGGDRASTETGSSPPAASTSIEGQARALMATEPARARELWLEVIALTPDNVRAYFNLGLVHIRLEEYQPAVSAFEQVLAMDATMIDAHFNLGYAYAKIGKYDAASDHYRKVIDQAPDYLDEVLFNLAIVQDFQNDRQGAARSLQDAIRHNPQNVRAIRYLARMEGRYSTPK